LLGGSDVPDYPSSTQMLARDTLGLMDHLEIDNARVLGKSMGGAIGQWIALEPLPHRSVDSRVTSSPRATSRKSAAAIEMSFFMT
jgi:pimeloyl-ACP methyl ester carboxylesterase